MHDSKRDFIKIIAMITMLIDHVGSVILPSWFFLRIIGRIAMPCYAYLIGQGFKSTKDSRKYFWRLLLLAVISQAGFAQFHPDKLNIIFTFALSVAVMSNFQNAKFIKAFLIAIIIAIGPFEYGLYATITIIAMQYISSWPITTSVIFIMISMVAGIIYKLAPSQVYAVLAIPFIYFAPINFKYFIPKIIWRLFYPVQWWGLVFWRFLCIGS